MSSPLPALAGPSVRRRDQQKDQTRFDLSLAAFELAREHGLASVRVPQIAAATGVSPRTFNNYFPSKEAAIVWPTTWRGSRLAASLGDRRTCRPRRPHRGCHRRREAALVYDRQSARDRVLDGECAGARGRSCRPFAGTRDAITHPQK